jgi:hypothetical protein
MDISVNSQGQGQYWIRDLSTEQRGEFQLSPQQFQRVVKRLRPFQQQAMPFNQETQRKILDAGCSNGAPPLVYDAGDVWVHWVGPSSSTHYYADLGCDDQLKGARNEELIAVVESLPIPLQKRSS